MYERLKLMYTLLAEDGSIYVHLDWRMTHHIKLILDDIFGSDKYCNQLIWKRGKMKGAKAVGNQLVEITTPFYLYKIRQIPI
jgi:adenine specific DNA methylase Mod